MRLTQGIVRAAMVRGRGTAIIDGAQSFTWNEIASRVPRFAAVLRGHGLSEGGALKLTFEVHNGLGELAISDTGREGQVPELGQGVGRTLMTAFAKQLRGTSSFTPNEDGGLTARLSFPIAEPQRAPVPKAATAPAGAPAQAESRNPVAAKPF